MALTTIIPNLKQPFAKPQSVSHISNGISTDINGVKFPLQTGVPVQPIYTFKVVPASISATAVAPAHNFGSTGSGGFIPLNTTVQGTGTDIISKPIVFLGQQAILLDCERSLCFYFSKATEGYFSAIVKGYDYRGVAVQTTVSNIAPGTTPSYVIPTPITIVTSIQFLENPYPSGDGTVSVGTLNYIGLPYLLINRAHVIYASWNGAALTPSSEIFPGFQWRQLGATNVNTCARGFVATPTNPDGTLELVLTYYVYGADSEINSEIQNLNQSSLKIVGVKQNTYSSQYVLPYLVPEDLTGVQIDAYSDTDGGGGDEKFFLAYVDAVTLPV